MGRDCPVYIIAEAGVAHFGREEKALRLVDLAVEGGADAVKFQIFDCSGTPISPANFPGDPTLFPSINVTKLSGITPAGLDIDDAGFSGDDGILFRWDPTDMQWIFNLKTNNTYDIGCTYLIWANLGDGVDHNVPIAIK